MIEHMFASESSEQVRNVVPPNLETIAPGPFLAAILSALDRSKLNGHDAIRVLQAETRMAAHYEALAFESITEVAHSSPSFPDSLPEREPHPIEFASEELQSALRLTRQAADARLELALVLRRRLPRVWQMLYQGRIDVRRARALARGTEHLDDTDARQVVDMVIEETPNLTTGEINARLRRLTIEVNPADATARYQNAHAERRVFVEASPDGTGELHAYGLPVARAEAIKNRLHDVAIHLKDSDETRTMDQLRTDILLDLLDGEDNASGVVTGTVNLHVDLATLAGLSEAPGEIGGFGPVIADVARQVARAQQAGTWEVIVTEDNKVGLTTTTSRRPTPAMKRRLKARHPRCVFPGCRMPSERTDVDHTRPWARGGRTRDRNLGPLCRRHHRAKDVGQWSYRISDDRINWMSPLGQTRQVKRGPPLGTSV